MPITVKELKNIKDNWIFLLQKHEWTMSFYKMVSLLPCCSKSVAVNPTRFWGGSTWPVISNMKFYHFFCKKKKKEKRCNIQNPWETENIFL